MWRLPWHRDPGPCPICGVAHTACVPGGPPLTVAVLGTPGGSVSARVQAPAYVLNAERIQRTLPPGQVTTATYRGPRPRGKAPKPLRTTR